MKTSNKIFRFLLLSLAFILTAHSAFELIQGFIDPTGALLGTGLASINLVNLGQVEDQEFADGTENMGGFGSRAYLALRSYIATYPALNVTDTSLENLVKLVGNFTMDTSRYFIKVDFANNTLGLTPESQGEHAGCRSFKLKGEGLISASGQAARGLARLLNNTSGVLILMRDDGSRLCLGDDKRPVVFKATMQFGNKAGDPVGIKLEFETDSFVPGYDYAGTILLDGETIPAS